MFHLLFVFWLLVMAASTGSVTLPNWQLALMVTPTTFKPSCKIGMLLNFHFGYTAYKWRSVCLTHPLIQPLNSFVSKWGMCLKLELAVTSQLSRFPSSPERKTSRAPEHNLFSFFPTATADDNSWKMCRLFRFQSLCWEHALHILQLACTLYYLTLWQCRLNKYLLTHIVWNCRLGLIYTLLQENDD